MDTLNLPEKMPNHQHLLRKVLLAAVITSMLTLVACGGGGGGLSGVAGLFSSGFEALAQNLFTAFDAGSLTEESLVSQLAAAGA